MAGEYPDLPHFGYGANIGVDLKDVLGLLPNSRQQQLTDEQINNLIAQRHHYDAVTKALQQKTPAEIKQIEAGTVNTLAMIVPQMRHLLSGAGVNDATIQRMVEMLPLEKQQMIAGTNKTTAEGKTEDELRENRKKLLGSQANAEQAQADRANKLAPLEAANLFVTGVNASQAPDLARLREEQELFHNMYTTDVGRADVLSDLMKKQGITVTPQKTPGSDKDKELFKRAAANTGAQPWGGAMDRIGDAWWSLIYPRGGGTNEQATGRGAPAAPGATNTPAQPTEGVSADNPLSSIIGLEQQSTNAPVASRGPNTVGQNKAGNPFTALKELGSAAIKRMTSPTGWTQDAAGNWYYKGVYTGHRGTPPTQTNQTVEGGMR